MTRRKHNANPGEEHDSNGEHQLKTELESVDYKGVNFVDKTIMGRIKLSSVFDLIFWYFCIKAKVHKEKAICIMTEEQRKVTNSIMAKVHKESNKQGGWKAHKESIYFPNPNPIA